jgi:excisionase family DNA binding protein
MQWFFDLPEAVDYLRAIGARRITTRLLRRLIRSGEIPLTRIGRKVYVKKESLDDWFVKNQRKKKRRKLDRVLRKI